jgi:hypothetical protein
VNIDRYMILRERLVELYGVLQTHTFPVHVSRASQMSLKTLQRIEKNPPINGTEWLYTVQERPLTILAMVNASIIMGDSNDIRFSSPHDTIPEIYEILQEYVGNWVELMINYGWVAHPPLEELDHLENFAKHIYPYYQEYKTQRIIFSSGKYHIGEMTLMDIMRIQMQSGQDINTSISFISNMGIYRDAQGLTSPSSNGFNFSALSGLTNKITSMKKYDENDPFNQFKVMGSGLGDL